MPVVVATRRCNSPASPVKTGFVERLPSCHVPLPVTPVRLVCRAEAPFAQRLVPRAPRQCPPQQRQPV